MDTNKAQGLQTDGSYLLVDRFSDYDITRDPDQSGATEQEPEAVVETPSQAKEPNTK